MRVKQFIAKLQSIDPKFRLVPGPGISSGIYKKLPRHPDASPAGLVWVGACPSPSVFFGSMPEKDVFINGNTYVRGWKTVLSLLVSQKHLSMRKAISKFGWDFTVEGIHGKRTVLKGWNDPVSKKEDMKRRIMALEDKHKVKLL